MVVHNDGAVKNNPQNIGNGKNTRDNLFNDAISASEYIGDAGGGGGGGPSLLMDNTVADARGGGWVVEDKRGVDVVTGGILPSCATSLVIVSSLNDDVPRIAFNNGEDSGSRGKTRFSENRTLPTPLSRSLEYTTTVVSAGEG